MKRFHSVNNIIYDIPLQKKLRNKSTPHQKKPKICKNCLLQILPAMFLNEEKQQYDIKTYGQQFAHRKSQQERKKSKEEQAKQKSFLKIIFDRLKNDQIKKQIQIPLFQVGVQKYIQQYYLKQKKWKQIQYNLGLSDFLARKFIQQQYYKTLIGQCFCQPQYDKLYWRLYNYKHLIVQMKLFLKTPMSDSLKLQAQMSVKLRDKYQKFFQDILRWQ